MTPIERFDIWTNNHYHQYGEYPGLETIANWWLNELSLQKQVLAEKVEGLKKELVGHEDKFSVLHKDGYNQAISDALALIKED